MTYIFFSVDNGIRILKNSNDTACIMVKFQADVTFTGINGKYIVSL